jgi:hypothetical protein
MPNGQRGKISISVFDLRRPLSKLDKEHKLLLIVLASSAA